MHHWGFKELEVGLGYNIEREPDNPKDSNAIVIKFEGRKMAYLKKDNAFIVSRMIKNNISTVIRLKPKENPVVKDRRVGPQQRCTVGFKVQDHINLKPTTDFLDTYCINYEIKKAN